MDDFERIFEAYGADYQVTLGRFMGNRKMYMSSWECCFRMKT